MPWSTLYGRLSRRVSIGNNDLMDSIGAWVPIPALIALRKSWIYIFQCLDSTCPLSTIHSAREKRQSARRLIRVDAGDNPTIRRDSSLEFHHSVCSWRSIVSAPNTTTNGQSCERTMSQQALNPTLQIKDPYASLIASSSAASLAWACEWAP
jgi:hypothetical protein